MRFWKNPAAVIVAAVALVVIVIGTFVVVHAKPSKPAGSFRNNMPAAAASATPMSVYQPPSARDVAISLHCKRFKDHGPSQIGGSIDSGACWIDGVKYAINTFPSKAVRDSWLRDAEPLGVVPKWETDTSVTYKSVA